MISSFLTFCTGVAVLCAALDAQGSEAEELFKKASAFYARNFGSSPWPGNEPNGFQLLSAAADAKYPAALQNMFLGHKLGFFGYPDERRATEYRIKWLVALDTPSSYLELARGHLGIWSTVSEPSGRNQKLPDGCIFVGEIALKERRAGPPETTFFGINDNEDRDEERFVFFAELAVDLGLSRRSNKTDRAAANAAAGLLIDGVIGNPISGPKGRKITVDFRHTRKASVLQTLVRATQQGLVSPEIATPALVKLFDALTEEELPMIFKVEQKAKTL